MAVEAPRRSRTPSRRLRPAAIHLAAAHQRQVRAPPRGPRAAFAGLLGVVLPQMPGPMRDNAAARSAWLELHRERLTASSRAPWTASASSTSSTVPGSTASGSHYRRRHRLHGQPLSAHLAQRPPPRQVVADRYFERAHHRADFTLAGGAAAVESALRSATTASSAPASADGATYLFAERFSGAATAPSSATSRSSCCLVGALLTKLAGFDRDPRPRRGHARRRPSSTAPARARSSCAWSMPSAAGRQRQHRRLPQHSRSAAATSGHLHRHREQPLLRRSATRFTRPPSSTISRACASPRPTAPRLLRRPRLPGRDTAVPRSA